MLNGARLGPVLQISSAGFALSSPELQGHRAIDGVFGWSAIGAVSRQVDLPGKPSIGSDRLSKDFRRSSYVPVTVQVRNECNHLDH